jgi:hypothetical protein
MNDGRRLSDIMKVEEKNNKSNEIMAKRSQKINFKGDLGESNSNNHSILDSNTPMSRAEILETLSYHILLIDRRVSGERFREQDGDKTRISYFRALAYAMAIYGTLLRDAELEDLEKRISALESVKTSNKGARR